MPLIVHGWLAGETAARRMLTTLTGKTDEPDLQALLTGSIDWSDWLPGDETAAGIVYGDGLMALLQQIVGVTPGTEGWAVRAAARGSILASIEDGRLDRVANALAQALSDGSSTAELTKVLAAVLDDPQWAEMVAVTETARAMTASSLATYAANGITAKQFLTAEDDVVCAFCNGNEDSGPVPLMGEFPYGDPPVHPMCRCALAPVTLLGTDAENALADQGFTFTDA